MTTSKTPKTSVTVRCLHTEHYITMGIEDAKDLELEDGQVVYPEQYRYIVSYLSNKSDTPKHPE